MVVLYLLCVATFASAAFIKEYHEESPPCGTLRESRFESSRQGRILGGREAYPAEIPWVVSLQNKDEHFCGGSILDKKHILTAAHCFDANGNEFSKSEMSVIMGAEKLSTIDRSKTTIIKIKSIINHPDYKNYENYLNDIAILKLEEDIVWSPYVRPIDLPKEEIPSEITATASGWGQSWGTKLAKTRVRDSNTLEEIETFNEYSQYSDTLMAVNLTIFENKCCDTIYKRYSDRLTLANTQLCAGSLSSLSTDGIRQDAARGDSGGPLAVLLNGRWTIAGITSAEPKFPAPAIYSRVSSYIKWIEETMQD